MAVLITNATISTYANGTAKLVSVAANLSRPKPKDEAPAGGIIRHILLLDPSSDIQAGDDVQILAWPPFAVNTAARYRVFSATPVGNFGMEAYRAVIGERIQR